VSRCEDSARGNWRIDAVERAIQSAPKFTWLPEIAYDFDSQRLDEATMRLQFLDLAARAHPKVEAALAQWCESGRWPKVPSQIGYFLRLLLGWVKANPGESNQTSESSTVSQLREAKIEQWLRGECARLRHSEDLKDWASCMAREAFADQERMHRLYEG
jgi:hypothetical protein